MTPTPTHGAVLDDVRALADIVEMVWRDGNSTVPSDASDSFVAFKVAHFMKVVRATRPSHIAAEAPGVEIERLRAALSKIARGDIGPVSCLGAIIAAMQAFARDTLAVGAALDDAQRNREEAAPLLTRDEQHAQAMRCACKGTDDYCVCQNIPDRQTLADRTTKGAPAPAST